MNAANTYNQLEYTAQYLLAKCAEEFSAYLTDRNMSASTKKNYLADLRSFFRWLSDSGVSTQAAQVDTVQDFLRPITHDVLENYRRSLVIARIPSTTLNRRLTTMRTFFLFASITGYVKDNPTAGLMNIPASGSRLDDDTITSLISEYETDQKNTHSWVASDREDIREFFRWYREQVTA